MCQDKFKANEANKTRYNEIRKEYIATLRQTEPEKMRQQNIKDVRAFKEREKAHKEILKSMNTLTDAIRARKARAELTSLKAAAAAAKPKNKKNKRRTS